MLPYGKLLRVYKSLNPDASSQGAGNPPAGLAPQDHADSPAEGKRQVLQRGETPATDWLPSRSEQF